MDVLILLVGLLCLALGLFLGAKFKYYDNLKTVNGELEAQLAKRRHTYATANGLEDALAVAIEQLLREEAQAKYRHARIDQMKNILGMVREGPLSYDSDRSADRPAE